MSKSLKNKVWERIYKHTEEHYHVGECALDATHKALLPSADDVNWFQGKPPYNHPYEVLTLNHCYPSGVIITIEKYRTNPSIFQYPNHNPFDGTIAWMPLDKINFEEI